MLTFLVLHHVLLARLYLTSWLTPLHTKRLFGGTQCHCSRLGSYLFIMDVRSTVKLTM